MLVQFLKSKANIEACVKKARACFFSVIPSAGGRLHSFRNKGFTLIELMVVISIISIMTVIAVSNYNAQRRSKELSFAAQKLFDDIRKTQNNSINVLRHGGDDTSGGYGLHFSTSSPDEYIIFLDTIKDKQYTGGDALIETIALPAGTGIGSLTGAVTVADVVFHPPYGKVSILYNGAEQVGATLEINLEKDSQTKTVTINHEGKIDE